jgi:hypothetical protein
MGKKLWAIRSPWEYAPSRQSEWARVRSIADVTIHHLHSVHRLSWEGGRAESVVVSTARACDTWGICKYQESEPVQVKCNASEKEMVSLMDHDSRPWEPVRFARQDLMGH